MRLVAMLVLIGLSGCASVGPRYYVASFERTPREPTELAPPPSEEARELLAGATTVAFVAPKPCEGQCMAQLADLEAEALRAGFQVVSWQALDGPSPPLEYAREHAVDVLFEISELSFEAPLAELHRLERVRLYESDTRGSDGQREILSGDVDGMIARCRERFWDLPWAPPSVTLDVKMVSVASGRVAWQLEKTAVDPEEQRAAVVERTWQASPSPSEVSTWGLIIGGTGLAGGAALALVPLLTDQPAAGLLLSPMFLVGLELAVLGGLVMAASFLVEPLFASYPPPEDLVCHAHATALEDRAPRSATFLEARRRELLRGLVRELMDDVAAMRGGTEG